MPYIRPELREDLLQLTSAESPGELNYAITTMLIDYIGDEPRYTKFNEVIGVLECAKQELYRRAVAPYEDRMIAMNGDVDGLQSG